jgi:L-ribulose-5-phosphate 3-epimerase
MSHSRRAFFGAAAVLAAGSTRGAEGAAPATRANPIGVSTYSFWQFKNDTMRPIEKCIERAGEMGFDAVEILHRQMTDESPAALQKFKRTAFVNGLSLCGFSTHQSFLYADAAERKKNVDLTIKQIEIAYAMGIPTMRVNTGTWKTSKNFDELMANKGPFYCRRRPITAAVPGIRWSWTTTALQKS